MDPYPVRSASRPVSDSVVFVMGNTGAGKTTFISALTGQDEGIVHALSSGTTKVAISNVEFRGKVIQLIDTPGFNDTWRSDDDILKEIAFMLSKVYVHGYKVAGVLYLHRISDNRVPGSALRSLRMLEKICGLAAAPRIFLVSTMWNQIRGNSGFMEQAEATEAELKATREYWQRLCEHGAHVRRFWADTNSAISILDNIVDQSETLDLKPLQLQTELVTEQKRLYQTGAGEALLAFHDLDDRECMDDSSATSGPKKTAARGSRSRADVSVSLEALMVERERAYRTILEQTESQHRVLVEDLHQKQSACRQLRADHNATLETMRDIETEWAGKQAILDERQRPQAQPMFNRDQDLRRLREEQRHVKDQYYELETESREQIENTEETVQRLRKREVMRRNVLPFLGVLAGGGVIAAGAVTGIVPLLGLGTGLALSSLDRLKLSRKQGRKDAEGKPGNMASMSSTSMEDLRET